MDYDHIQVRLQDQIFYLEWIDVAGLVRHGTGFFISPNLALTAYHNLPEEVLREPATPLEATYRGSKIKLFWKLAAEQDRIWQSKRDLAVLESPADIPQLRYEKGRFLPLTLGENLRRRQWRSRSVFIAGFPQNRGFAPTVVAGITDGGNPISDAYIIRNGERRLHVANAIYVNLTARQPLAGLQGLSGSPLYDPAVGGIVGVVFGLDPVITATELAYLRENWKHAEDLLQPWQDAPRPLLTRRSVLVLPAAALGAGAWLSRRTWWPAEEVFRVEVVRLPGGRRETLTSNTAFREGERVRFIVTIPVSGHLYIVNEELAHSGQPRQPYLVFPTLRTGAGRNKVVAGNEVAFPSEEDDPPYLEPRPLNDDSDYAGEALTILVYSMPLQTQLRNEPLLLSPDQFPFDRLSPRLFKQPDVGLPLASTQIRVVVRRSTPQ